MKLTKLYARDLMEWSLAVAVVALAAFFSSYLLVGAINIWKGALL